MIPRILIQLCAACGGWVSLSVTVGAGPAFEERGALLVLRLPTSRDVTHYDCDNGCGCYAGPPVDAGLAAEEVEAVKSWHAAVLAERAAGPAPVDFP